MITFAESTAESPTGHGSQFLFKKDAAIAALLKCGNVEQAANAVDIDPQTLRRWTKVPEFRIAYREARREAFSQCVASLQWASSTAVNTLTEIMLNTKASASARVRAAETILNHSEQAFEIEDLLARVEMLEQKENTA
jgi:transposase-like protein